LKHLTFPENYQKWYLHGEKQSVSETMVAKSANMVENLLKSQNPMANILNDAFGFTGHNVNDFDGATKDDDMQNNIVHDEGK